MATYLLIGIVVGIIQVIDSVLLLRSSGKIDKYSGTTSLIEFSWFFATIYYLLNYDFTLIGQIIAVGYLSYNITGWIAAGKIMSQVDTIDNVDSIIIPKSFVKAGIVFGSVYCLTCYFTLNANSP
ncbi:MAG: hypothetical protein ABW139_20965 [Candidatus Thiodiazotropha sp. DIVDIV]